MVTAQARLSRLSASISAVARVVAVRSLPIKGSNEKHFTTMLVAWPILGFLMTTLLTALFGVAREPACQGWRVFVAQLVLRQRFSTQCTSVPFLVDIPTVLLSFTAPFAAIGYLVILQRLAYLIPALEESRLIRRGAESHRINSAVAEVVERTAFRKWRSWLLFVVSYALTVWLYSRNIQSGGIFEALSSSTVSAADLRSRWWANYNSNVLLAVWCITVGAIGVHFSIASSWLYIKVSWIAIRANRRRRFEISPEYVPGWLDRSYGWSPITALAGIVYASAVNFAISMIAVFDMLHSGSTNLAVAVGVGSFGLASDLSISLIIILVVAGAHRNVRESTVAVLRAPRRARRRRASSPVANQARVLRRLPNLGAAGIDAVTEDLRRWPVLPIASPALGVLKIAPGLYALYQFTRSVMGTP